MFTFSSPIQQNYFFLSSTNDTENQHPFTTAFHHPTTPSPLRTSKYANLMTPPHSTQKKSSPGNSSVAATTPTSGPPAAQARYATRAANSTPANALARHALDGREKKKSQFLDRIKRRRDDARTEGTNDQVLRMDFVRERRGWEEQMRRVAVLEQGVAMDYVDEPMTGDEMEIGPDAQAEAEMSPTEEFGIDFDADLDAYIGQFGSQEDVADDDDDLDPEEYDRLFLEVLSQEQNQRSNQGGNRPPPAQNMHTLLSTEQPFQPQAQMLQTTNTVTYDQSILQPTQTGSGAPVPDQHQAGFDPGMDLS